MLRSILVAAIALGMLGCDSAGPPKAVSPNQYTVISEQANPSGALEVSIKLTGPASEPQVKSITEGVINDRKERFKNITVSTYVDGTGASRMLYSTSTFDGQTVAHTFNNQAQQQRVATH